MGILRQIAKAVAGEPVPGPKRQGPGLPRNPTCSACGDSVNQITRCERDGHGSHHAQCCTVPKPTPEE
jgi:hypothetical protein